MADPGAMTASTLSIGQTVFAYTAFLPRLSEVRRASVDDPGMRGDVILGQVAAGATSLAIAGTLSYLTGSSLPVWTTIVIAAVIAAIYHYAMNGGSYVGT